MTRSLVRIQTQLKTNVMARMTTSQMPVVVLTMTVRSYSHAPDIESCYDVSCCKASTRIVHNVPLRVMDGRESSTHYMASQRFGPCESYRLVGVDYTRHIVMSHLSWNYRKAVDTAACYALRISTW